MKKRLEQKSFLTINSITELEKSDKSKIEFKNESQLDEAITYLRAILDGLEKEKLSFAIKDKRTDLKPSDRVEFGIKAESDLKKEKLTLKLSWKKELKKKEIYIN